MFHGRPLEIVDSQSLFLFNSSIPARTLSVDRLGPYFLYLILECSLSSAVPHKEPVHFNVDVESPIGGIFYRSSDQYNITFSAAGIPDPILLFYERISSRHLYNFYVEIVSNVTDFSGISVALRRGNPAICASLISMKFGGCIFIVFVALYFLYQFRCAPEALRLTTEQKLTAVLTIFCLFSDDPFSGLFVHHPTFSVIALRLIVAALFRVFVRYYVALLFESVRLQRRTGASLRDWLLLAFFVAIATVDILASFGHELDALHSRFKKRVPVLARYIAELAADGAVAVCAIGGYEELDSSESFRFTIYAVHFSLWLITVTAVSTFRTFSVKNEMNPVLILGEFLAHNYFVGMMNFVHATVEDGKSYANPSSALNHMIMESAGEYEESDERVVG
jgi:hypothetical protein